jgi:hypothetical protein
MSTQPQGGPRLYAAVQHPKPEAIVVHCSDPRFQIAFEQFVTNELKLAKGTYLPIVIGGGAGVLGHPEQLPKEFKFLKDRFEFFRERFPSLRRVVLINHQDCLYYENLKSKLLSLLGTRLFRSPEVAREDLGLVARVCDRLLSHLGWTVDLYYAKFADAEHSKIAFERLDQ